MSISKVLTMAVATVGLLATTACEPPAPIPTIQVDSLMAGDDTNPGDGECMTDPYVGCTAPAAIQEANALGRAIVLVPGNSTSNYAGVDITITGSLTIRVEDVGTGNDAYLDSGAIGVAPGAHLSIEALGINFGTIDVDGVLTAERTTLASINVGQDGIALVNNSVLIPADEPAVTNQGQIWLNYSTIALWNPAGGLVTLGSGQTSIGATAVLATADSGATTCFGTSPTSQGYNAVTDAGCALSDATDLEGVDPIDFGGLFPAPGSPLIDAIPVGALGCGTSVTTDARGLNGPRPTDGDANTTTACDIGAYEV